MTAGFSRRFRLGSPEATTRLAQALAPQLTRGDTVLLRGGLGSGKTHFARSLIQARLATAGLAEEVPSPTYTLVQTYFDGVAEIWHADLYRLTGPDEVLELGLDEAFREAIVLVEWPDRLAEVPAGALTLTFEPGGNAEFRNVTASSDDPRWAGLLSDRDTVVA